MLNANSVVEALKEEGILHDNHTILPKYFDVRGIHIITDRGKEIYFRSPLSFLLKMMVLILLSKILLSIVLVEILKLQIV